MKGPGRILHEAMKSFFKKPATQNYPAEKTPMPPGFRGKLQFIPEKCIGCRLCMKDCPAQAIVIEKVGEKRFECHIDLSKCIYCGQCTDTCMKKALLMTGEFELAGITRNELKIVYAPAALNPADAATPKPQAPAA